MTMVRFLILSLFSSSFLSFFPSSTVIVMRATGLSRPTVLRSASSSTSLSRACRSAIFCSAILDLLRVGLAWRWFLETPLRLLDVFFLFGHLDEDQVVIAVLDLETFDVVGFEAGQAWVAQLVERDGDVLELVSLDHEDLVIAIELGEAIFLGDLLRRPGRHAELGRRRSGLLARLRLRHLADEQLPLDAAGF